MVKVVQFLERQQYDVKEAAEQQLAFDQIENEKKIKGKVAAK